MFSQKKKFYEKRSFYIGLMAVLVAFGIWINYTPEEAVGEDGLLLSQIENDDTKEVETTPGQASQPGLQTGKRVLLNNESDSLTQQISPGTSQREKEEEDTLREMDFNSAEDDYSQWSDYPYYLIAEENGKILVYYYDLSGQQTLVRTTSIAFNLLSETDQQLFREGIRKETEDEMMDLLQDFES